MGRAYRLSDLPPGVYTEPLLYRRLNANQNEFYREVRVMESAARDRKRKCLQRAAALAVAGGAGLLLDGLSMPFLLGFFLWWGAILSFVVSVLNLLEANVARIEIESLAKPESLTSL